MPIPLESALDDGAELLGEVLMVEEMMNPQAGTGRLSRVGWANPLLRCPNAVSTMSAQEHVGDQRNQASP
jgi:hypothetical protein